MKILEIPPDAPLVVAAAAKTILYLHIGGGTLGMIFGAIALFSAKGGWVHRKAGDVFVAAMLVMSGIGAVVSPFLHDRVSSVAGMMTFYMVLTAWLTVKRAENTTSRWDAAGLLVALGVVAAGATFALMAANAPSGTVDGQPPQAFTVFMIVGSIAAACDLKVILSGGISGAPRLARHLWRMCTALAVAAGSFFLGQQKFLPKALHGSPLLFIPTLLPLAMLIFWMIRVRLTTWYKTDPVAP
jgi:uncharacterized membrane protein